MQEVNGTTEAGAARLERALAIPVGFELAECSQPSFRSLERRRRRVGRKLPSV
jgi:hypothetical protein